jgi:hypothetical protein
VQWTFATSFSAFVTNVPKWFISQLRERMAIVRFQRDLCLRDSPGAGTRPPPWLTIYPPESDAKT